MQSVHHSEILPYAQAALFDLVCDIEAYPDFLPWCGSVIVHRRDEAAIEASVEVKKGFMSKSFTTRNELTRPSAIDMHLLEGPFKHLHGVWHFDALTKGKAPETTVSLSMEFELDSGLIAGMIGPIFGVVSDTMLHHFCERAHAILGHQTGSSS